jgi:hypothetical protein
MRMQRIQLGPCTSCPPKQIANNTARLATALNRLQSAVTPSCGKVMNQQLMFLALSASNEDTTQLNFE